MKIGDKVKCINDVFKFDRSTPKEYNGIKLPKKDEIYTIRRVVVARYDQSYGLLLEEIKNPEIYHSNGGKKEPIFGIERFVDIQHIRNDKLEELGI